MPISIPNMRLTRFLLCMIAMLWWLPVAAQDTDASGVVEQFQASLLAAMKDAQTLGYQGRYERLKPAIEDSHDLPGIAKFAAGRYWEGLSETDQTRLIDTFTRHSIATYAFRFDGYANQAFKTLGEEKLVRGDTLVQSQFSDPAGDTLRFDYVMCEENGRWRITNIIVDGVSDLAIKRSEYSSILRKQDVSALIAKLEQQIEQYAGKAKP